MKHSLVKKLEENHFEFVVEMSELLLGEIYLIKRFDFENFISNQTVSI